MAIIWTFRPTNFRDVGQRGIWLLFNKRYVVCGSDSCRKTLELARASMNEAGKCACKQEIAESWATDFQNGHKRRLSDIDCKITCSKPIALSNLFGSLVVLRLSLVVEKKLKPSEPIFSVELNSPSPSMRHAFVGVMMAAADRKKKPLGWSRTYELQMRHLAILARQLQTEGTMKKYTFDQHGIVFFFF